MWIAEMTLRAAASSLFCLIVWPIGYATLTTGCLFLAHAFNPPVIMFGIEPFAALFLAFLSGAFLLVLSKGAVAIMRRPTTGSMRAFAVAMGSVAGFTLGFMAAFVCAVPVLAALNKLTSAIPFGDGRYEEYLYLRNGIAYLGGAAAAIVMGVAVNTLDRAATTPIQTEFLAWRRAGGVVGPVVLTTEDNLPGEGESGEGPKAAASNQSLNL
jgi:hypothetical protein